MLSLKTARLKIIPLTRALLQKLLNGTPELEAALSLAPSGMELDAHTHEAMQYLFDLAAKTPNSFPWITNWQIIEKERNIAIGSACFMNVPNEKGEVEIGYGIYPAFQNQGFMTEALESICRWALNQPGVAAIHAETEPENIASHRVLGKCAFQQLNEQKFSPPSTRMIATDRLYLREMTQADFPALCKILQDEAVMYAYEGAFSDAEVQVWLDNQLRRYREDNVGLWAVILKENHTMIGQCGLTMQPWKERKLLEVGYLFQKAFWHCGYATEAAQGCRDYAFQTLHAEAVYSIIRDNNSASRCVAERNGMAVVDQGIKHYRGIDMPHVLYKIKRNEKV